MKRGQADSFTARLAVSTDQVRADEEGVGVGGWILEADGELHPGRLRAVSRTKVDGVNRYNRTTVVRAATSALPKRKRSPATACSTSEFIAKP